MRRVLVALVFAVAAAVAVSTDPVHLASAGVPYCGVGKYKTQERYYESNRNHVETMFTCLASAFGGEETSCFAQAVDTLCPMLFPRRLGPSDLYSTLVTCKRECLEFTRDCAVFASEIHACTSHRISDDLMGCSKLKECNCAEGLDTVPMSAEPRCNPNNVDPSLYI